MQQLDERLKGQYASLSPQEQRVADSSLTTLTT
ncbi:Putative rpiR-family transcriptional regulatory protein [Klebsiella aerogenes]|nr:Putative rpiR-family transcriptional regulatory protein [Klebsiella aerogenes]